jgi:hypothetical protein
MQGTILYVIFGMALMLPWIFGEKFCARSLRLRVPIPARYWRIWLLILGGMLLAGALPGEPPPVPHRFLATVIPILAAFAFPAGVFAVLIGWGLCWGKDRGDQRARLCGMFAMLWGGSLVWYALAIFAAHQ